MSNGLLGLLADAHPKLPTVTPTPSELLWLIPALPLAGSLGRTFSLAFSSCAGGFGCPTRTRAVAGNIGCGGKIPNPQFQHCAASYLTSG